MYQYYPDTLCFFTEAWRMIFYASGSNISLATQTQLVDMLNDERQQIQREQKKIDNNRETMTAVSNMQKVVGVVNEKSGPLHQQ